MPQWSIRPAEQDLDAEIAAHLALEIQENIARGLSPEDARRAALRKFGNVALAKERTREAWGWTWIETLAQDLRYALRTLRRSPGFTAVAVLTLALGIGASTAIFGVVHAVLLRPLPYRDPGRLAMVWSTVTTPDFSLQETDTAHPNFLDWKAQSQAFEAMDIMARDTSVLIGAEEPERIVLRRVSADFFAVLGIAPALGRTFSVEQVERRERVAVLSHSLWQRRFGSSPDILGKKIELEGGPSEVIGVMPPGFYFPSTDTELWEPYTLDSRWLKMWQSRRTFKFGFDVVARLQPGVTFQQAQAEMDAITQRLGRQYPDTNAGIGVKVVPLAEQTTGHMRRSLSLLFGAAALVLLIACTNVAGLLLARGAARQPEFALRAALGAGRARLMRQVLTESVALSIAAGFFGILLARAAIRILIAFGPADIPRLDEISVDATVLAFAMGLSLLTGILFGVAPAWRGSGQSVPGSRRWTTRTDRRFRSLLVISEFALAAVLLSGAGLLIRSFRAIQAVDPGFRPEHILTLRLSLPATKTDGQRLAYFREAIARVQAIPGVRAAGAIGGLFYSPSGGTLAITVEGHPPVPAGQSTAVVSDRVSGAYFQAMGVPLLRGRFFNDQDGPGRPLAAIINETMASRFWPGQDPIGTRFTLGIAGPTESMWRTVVGVVGDMRRQGLDRDPLPQYFEPDTQRSGTTAMDVVVLTTSDPLTLAAAVRREVRSIDKTAVLLRLATVEQQLEEQTSQRRFQTWLVTVFAVMALLLAAIGIYGLMHYTVAQRTHEIGVRMALGARPGDVLAMVLRHGLLLATAGVAAGLLVALWITQALAGFLYGVTATDPVTFAVASGALMAAAFLACYIPARRVARVDPMIALRYE